MSYTVTRDGKTFDQLTDEVDALTIREIGIEIMESVHDSHIIENLNTGNETGEAYYNNLKAYTLVGDTKVYATKLIYSNFQIQMTSHTDALKADLVVEFDELQRVDDLSVRLDALKHWSQAALELGQYNTYANYAFFKKAIIDSNDTAFITSIEAKDLEIENERVFQAGVEEKVARMVLGQRIIATINKMNEDNSVTGTQLGVILTDTDILQIMQALETGSLLTAKALMQAKDLTGLSPMDDTYKTRVIGMIDTYLGL